jgi:hypothetical protein
MWNKESIEAWRTRSAARDNGARQKRIYSVGEIGTISHGIGLGLGQRSKSYGADMMGLYFSRGSFLLENISCQKEPPSWIIIGGENWTHQDSR